MSAKRYKIRIYIKDKKEESKKRKFSLTRRGKKCGFHYIQFPRDTVFVEHTLRNSGFLQGQFSLRIVLDLLSGESKPMEPLYAPKLHFLFQIKEANRTIGLIINVFLSIN